MPETTSLDEDVQTKQETPVEETPSVETGAVESEETPAETTSEQTEEAAPKTQDQVGEDKKFFQNAYQEAQAELKSLRPGVEEEPAKQPTVTQPAATQPAPAQPQMTDEEINQQLTDNPMLAMRMMSQEFSATIDTRLARHLEESKALRGFERESDQANLILSKYISSEQVSNEEYKAAKDELDARGIKGRPIGFTQEIMDKIEINRFKNHSAGRVDAAVAKATQAVKTQALTAQPTAGEVAQPEAKTQKEKIAGMFKRSGAEQKLDGFFKKAE